MGSNKGLGPDQISAEIIKVCGRVYDCALNKFINASYSLTHAPRLWRGGATTDGNIRRLLLSDHSSKVFTGLLRDDSGDSYDNYVPKSQFGSTRHRGTAFASHLIKLSNNFATTSSVSICS